MTNFLHSYNFKKKESLFKKTHYAATTNVAKKVLENVEYPLIMKLSEGTHGKGVIIAESKKSALTILDLLESFQKAYLIQEFIETKKHLRHLGNCYKGENIGSLQKSSKRRRNSGKHTFGRNKRKTSINRNRKRISNPFSRNHWRRHLWS